MAVWEKMSALYTHVHAIWLFPLGHTYVHLCIKNVCDKLEILLAFFCPLMKVVQGQQFSILSNLPKNMKNQIPASYMI